MPPQLHNTRMLILDGEVHSVYQLAGGRSLTGGAYYDYLSLLPVLVPPGPISILGLAGGTIARSIYQYFPDRHLHGWELDEAVVMAADMHLGLDELRRAGKLDVHVGDALAPDAAVPGGSAGIVVDLFGGARLIPPLQRVEAWHGVASRLAPGGRIMANMGAGPSPGSPLAGVNETFAALDALHAAVGELQIFHARTDVANNIVAVSGPAWDIAAATAALPADLQPLMDVQWKPYVP